MGYGTLGKPLRLLVSPSWSILLSLRNGKGIGYEMYECPVWWLVDLETPGPLHYSPVSTFVPTLWNPVPTLTIFVGMFTCFCMYMYACVCVKEKEERGGGEELNCVGGRCI